MHDMMYAWNMFFLGGFRGWYCWIGYIHVYGFHIYVYKVWSWMVDPSWVITWSLIVDVWILGMISDLDGCHKFGTHFFYHQEKNK